MTDSEIQNTADQMENFQFIRIFFYSTYSKTPSFKMHVNVALTTKGCLLCTDSVADHTGVDGAVGRSWVREGQIGGVVDEAPILVPGEVEAGPLQG